MGAAVEDNNEPKAIKQHNKGDLLRLLGLIVPMYFMDSG